MSIRATKLATILEGRNLLELPEGKTLSLDNRKFIQWLSNQGNRSFRFIAGFNGEKSFTARKETSKKGEGDYWYAYRRVEEKLHKRYIGKAEDVTLRRLEEVAVALESPPLPRKKAPKIDEVTQEVSVTETLKIAQLEAEIQRLQNELGNTQAQLEAALGETVA
jgi:uncharacterized small protein (DUF1192 family)